MCGSNDVETIVRGRTWSFDAVHYDEYLGEGDAGNVVTNHTGWGPPKAQVRNRVTGALVIELPVTFPVPTAGTIAIRLNRAFTKVLSLSKTGELWWDMVATDTNGIDNVIVYPEPFDVSDYPTRP